MKNILLIPILILLLSACSSDNVQRTAEPETLHRMERRLTELIIKDIFTPPVASRIYVYPSLAAWEAARYLDTTGNPSFTARLKGFEPMPVPDLSKGPIDFELASIRAFCATARRVVFSKPDIDLLDAELTDIHSLGMDDETIERSLAFGQAVADVVIKRLAADQYLQTRGMERFEVVHTPGRWVPTPPDYADGTEPHWPKIRTMVMDSSDQFNIPNPIPYSEDKNSPFWKELTEVHETVNRVKDGSEEMDILTFWDDNPFVSRHKGHLMFQDKKMTPGGHWMAITRVICRNEQTDFVRTAKAYALTSVSLFEAFISCWDLKYSAALVRPETVISAKVEQEWHPHLITPPFPSYTSGHSTISAAAAESLTALFGDQVAFTDSTELEFGLPVRSFPSFRDAAKEASISRVYAGIHYRSDCEQGNHQGTMVGQFVAARLVGATRKN
ncbi:MAG: vanadium-dependent haloperoxidase [Bacteroidota bacterium]